MISSSSNFQSTLENFNQIQKSEKVRFIEKAGKLAKFVIPLQDAHERGSTTLARVEAELD